MRNEHESCAVIERALEVVNAEADASYISIDHNITRFANSQIHQNMSEESAWLTLRVIVGNAMGVATTTVFDDDEIARTAELAREAARHSNPILGFDGLYRDNEPVPQLDTFDERTAAISPLEKARALRAMFDRGVRANVTFAGAYATGAASVWCGNTHGVRRFARMTHADATVIAVGANASGYATARERRTSSVDVGMLGDEATLEAKLESHARPRQIVGRSSQPRADRERLAPRLPRSRLGVSSRHERRRVVARADDQVDEARHLDHALQLRQRTARAEERADDRHDARRHVPRARRRGRGAAAEPALDAVDDRGVLEHRGDLA